jgi:tetratricopeptide (TPR) repeat protein
VPAGRSRCGRCGDPGLQNAATEPTERRSWPMQISAIGGVIVVAGVAVGMLVGSREPAAQVLEQVTTSSAPVQTATAPRLSGSSPAPVFAGAEASREGIAAYNNGDMAAAVTQFTAAVERDPNNADTLNNLGQVLVRTGRAREAIPYFDRAIAIADKVWSYQFNRARAYGELKEWRQAVAGYTDAARLFPDDYVTQFNLAKARQANGDLPGALESYGKAIELAPGQADFHLYYGQALDVSGKTREAGVEYRRYLELEPKGSEAEKIKARLTELGATTVASP